MRDAWEWLKKWGGVVFGALATVLLALLGAGWLWRRRTAELGRVKDELALANAQREIARLRGAREEIAREVGEKDEAVEILDQRIADNQRAIVEAYENGQGLSDQEVLDALDRLGL